MFFDIVPIFILLLAGVAMGGQVLSECRAWGWRNISAVLYRTAFALGLVEALMFIGTAGIAWYGWAMEQKILKLERERRERGKIVRTQA